MHQIIALWAHPRSMSTAVERLMRERGDLDCLHEPFMYAYYGPASGRTMPHFEFDRDHPTGYAGVRDMILRRAQNQPVFLKDMAYYVIPEIFDDPALLDRVSHAFLVRDPQAALLSYSRIDPELTRDEVGIEAQWRLFDHIRTRTGTPPPVLLSETVRADPRGMIGKFWAALGLPCAEHAFNWDGDVPDDWQHVAGWHGSVIGSTGIAPPGEENATQRQREFQDAVRARPALADFLDHHQPYYQRLAAHALPAPD